MTTDEKLMAKYVAQKLKEKSKKKKKKKQENQKNQKNQSYHIPKQYNIPKKIDEDNIDWTDIAYTQNAVDTRDIVLAGHSTNALLQSYNSSRKFPLQQQKGMKEAYSNFFSIIQSHS